MDLGHFQNKWLIYNIVTLKFQIMKNLFYEATNTAKKRKRYIHQRYNY